MKYLVNFTEYITTKREVRAIVEAEDEEYIKGAIEDGDYEVEDCYDCYDIDWKLGLISDAKLYDETLVD